MWEMRGKLCVIFALAVNLSNGYHIEAPGSISGSFSGSSSSSSSFSSASSSSFSGAINGNLDSQHFGKLVEGLKNGAASSAINGATAGAHSGADGVGCTGSCNGGGASQTNQDTVVYDAKYSATNQNGKINSNIIPTGYTSCASCKGPYPGPDGSIHDYKLVSEIKGNSIAPSPAVPTVPSIPHVIVPVGHHSEPPIQFPGSPGSIFDSKPASIVPTIPAGHSSSSVQTGGYGASGIGSQATQGYQNTFSGVAIHKGNALSPEFITKLPGAPGSIYDSISATGGQGGTSAAGGSVYPSIPVHNIPILPGAPGGIHDSIPATGSYATAGTDSHTSTGAESTGHNIEVGNIPVKHPLEGPACIRRPGSPPDGCGHAPEIVVPAPQAFVPSTVQPSRPELGPVSKPDFHQFPGPSGSIHESKPAQTGSVTIAGAHSTANAGGYDQTGSHQVTLPAVTGTVPIGKFPGPTIPTTISGSGSHSVSGSSIFQSGTNNTGSYSEFDLPNQGVYYINKDTPAPSLILDLQAPHQHPQTPSFSAQVPCNEADKTCGIKPITEPTHGTERTPSCIGDHCGGQAQPALPTVVNIGPGTGPKPSDAGFAHAAAGASGSSYTSTNQGIQVTNYKPFPSANCLNGGSCTGEYPKPNCENGVCGQPITGYNQKPEESLNLQPIPSEGFPGDSQNKKPYQPNTACQNNGLCGQTAGFGTGNVLAHGQQSGFATGQVSIHQQDGSVYNIKDDKQNKPYQSESQQPTGFPDYIQKPYQANTACQKNGLCGQTPGFGTGELLVPNQNAGFATGGVSIHKQDGSVYNIEDDKQNKPYQPEDQQSTGFPNNNENQKPQQPNTACQKTGLCGQSPGFGTGELLVPNQGTGFATGSVSIHKQDGSVYNIEDDKRNKPYQPEDQQSNNNNENQKPYYPNTACQKNGLCGQTPGFGTGDLLVPNQGTDFATGSVAISEQDKPGSKLNTPCQKNGLCGQTPGFGVGQVMVNGQVPQTSGFATGNVYVHKHDGTRVQVVEDSNLDTSGQFESQGSSGCTTGSCGFGSGSNFEGSQQFGGNANGFATGQVVVQRNDGSVNDITNSGCSSGNCGGQVSDPNYGGSSGGQTSSYGGGGSFENSGSYGCLSGSCANGGSNTVHRGSYGTGSGSYQGSSGSYSSGQKYDFSGGNFQPYGALAGSKVHGGGSYANSGAFASSGSFGGPLSHSFGLSRLTDGSSGAAAGSYAKVGSYAGAGSSAGSYASASAGSFSRSY